MAAAMILRAYRRRHAENRCSSNEFNADKANQGPVLASPLDDGIQRATTNCSSIMIVVVAVSNVRTTLVVCVDHTVAHQGGKGLGKGVLRVPACPGVAWSKLTPTLVPATKLDLGIMVSLPQLCIIKMQLYA